MRFKILCGLDAMIRHSIPGTAECTVVPHLFLPASVIFPQLIASGHLQPVALFLSPTLALVLIILYILLCGVAMILWNRLRRAKSVVTQVDALRAELQQCHQLENQLRRVRDQYRVIFRANAYPMWIFDDETLCFLEVNDAMVAKYGFSREQLLQMSVLDIRPLEEVPRFLQHRDDIKAHATGTWTHRAKDGTLMEMEITVHRLRFEDRPARFVMAVDVSAEKKFERALIREKERSDLLSDIAGRLLYAEDPPAILAGIFEPLAQYAHADVYLNFLLCEDGQTFRLNSSAGLPEHLKSQLRLVPFEGLLCGASLRQRRPFITDLQHCCNPNAAVLHGLGLRAYVCFPLQPNGRLLGTLAFGSRTKAAFADEELELFQNVSRYLSLAMDRLRLIKNVTAHARQVEEFDQRLRGYTAELEQRVAERTANLENTVRFLENLLHHVAHDLRSPLRALHGFTELLTIHCGQRLDAETLSYSSKLKEACKRMDRLIHDLLIFGRLGHQALSLATVDLGSLIDTLLDGFREQIAARHATVEVVRPFPTITGDSELVRLSLQNLVSNALKFVPEGTPPKLRISSRQTGNKVLVHVEDNGIGIPPEYQGRIFGVFERLHPDEAYSGTGIGLAIVKKAMERLGGEVTVHSEPGVGSRFCLAFKTMETV